MPAASAVDDPEIPAKIMLTTTLICPRPPLKCPTMACESSTSRWVIPEEFIRFAARMKNGTARSTKLP